MASLDNNDKSMWVNKNWLVGILVIIVAGLLTVGTNDQLNRTRTNELHISEITERLSKVEANQQRVLEQLQANGVKLDRLIEREIGKK